MFFEDRAFVLTRYYYASEGVVSSCLTEHNGKITVSSRRLLRSEKLGGKLDPLTLIDLEYYDDSEHSLCLFLSSQIIFSSQMHHHFSLESFYSLSLVAEVCHFFLAERMVDQKLFSIIEYFLNLEDAQLCENFFLTLMVFKTVVLDSFFWSCSVCFKKRPFPCYLNIQDLLFYCSCHVPLKKQSKFIKVYESFQLKMMEMMFMKEKMEKGFVASPQFFYFGLVFILVLVKIMTGRTSSSLPVLIYQLSKKT